MLYKIGFRKRAAKEYLEAIAWYKERSLQAAENFVSIIQKTIDGIERDPEHFRNNYKIQQENSPDHLFAFAVLFR